MNCFECDRPSHGICRFCGRAVCKDHFESKNFILDIYPAHHDDHPDQVLAVDDVLWCKKCKPIGSLVPIHLKPQKSKAETETSTTEGETSEESEDQKPEPTQESTP